MGKHVDVNGQLKETFHFTSVNLCSSKNLNIQSFEIYLQ